MSGGEEGGESVGIAVHGGHLVGRLEKYAFSDLGPPPISLLVTPKFGHRVSALSDSGPNSWNFNPKMIRAGTREVRPVQESSRWWKELAY